MQLNVNNIGYSYGKNSWLFHDISLHIESGEIVGLKGPSGQGKTTLCKIIAGYLKAQKGTVTIDGQPLNINKGFYPVQMVFQHPEKSVNPRWRMNNLLHEAGLEPHTEILELLGIQPQWYDRYPNELSGGELQRFCVARALSQEAKFLIADEMTTMLDAITQAQIWNALLEINQTRRMGILMVSHDDNLLNRMCDRIITLDTTQ